MPTTGTSMIQGTTADAGLRDTRLVKTP